MHELPIERMALPPAAELRAHLEARETPVVVEGGARGTRAFERFSPDYVKKTVGHVVVPHKLSSGHQHPDFGQTSMAKMFARGESSIAELVDAITKGPAEERSRRLFTGDERFVLRRRAGETTRDADLAPLLDDAGIPPGFEEKDLYTVWAWFSGAGVRTWLHYDNNGCHNLNAQLTGEKECVLFSPFELRRLYPFVLGAGNPATNCSRVDVEAVDASLFGEFADVPRWTARLSAGDLLFIPAWWWHSFRHLGAFNANVNYWWKPARPAPSPTSMRQAFLDSVGRAKLDARGDSPDAAVLRRLDEAAIAMPPESI